MALTTLRGFKNGGDDTFRIAVMAKRELAVLRGDVGHVTRLGTNVQNRRAHRQNVVDLARVNNTDKLFPHDDDVQISGGQRAGKLVEWLVR